VPGDPVAQAALGYLHANCGHCHRGGKTFDARVSVGLTQLSDAAIYKLAAGCTPLKGWKGHVAPDDHSPYYYVIDPGSSFTSGMIGRMSIRAQADAPEPRVDKDNQMPKIGTELVDDQGLEIVSAFIDQLKLSCPMPPDDAP
jgi:hypothetical protein